MPDKQSEIEQWVIVLLYMCSQLIINHFNYCKLYRDYIVNIVNTLVSYHKKSFNFLLIALLDDLKLKPREDIIIWLWGKYFRMAATFGCVGEFNSSLDDWTSNSKHLDHYLAANDVQHHNRWWWILLSTCGAATYRLIRNLTTPLSLVETSHKEIMELVQQHYNHRPTAIVQRLKFNYQIWQQGGSMSNFVARLKHS